MLIEKELQALSNSVIALQKLFAEEALTGEPKSGKSLTETELDFDLKRKPIISKFTKEEATYWRSRILSEVRFNDKITREDLIRRKLMPFGKDEAKYKRMYSFISNMVRNRELFVKDRGLTVHEN